MTSVSKKKKARNSFLNNGGEKLYPCRMKRIAYYGKRERKALNSKAKEVEAQNDDWRENID